MSLDEPLGQRVLALNLEDALLASGLHDPQLPVIPRWFTPLASRPQAPGIAGIIRCKPRRGRLNSVQNRHWRHGHVGDAVGRARGARVRVHTPLSKVMRREAGQTGVPGRRTHRRR